MNRNITKVYIIRLFYWMYFFSGIIVPFYLDWGGITFSQALIINAWFQLCVFFLEIPTGTVADFFGRKTSMILSSFVCAAALLVYTSYPSFFVFMIGEFLFAIGFTLMSGADEALVYDTLKEIGRESESKKIYSRMESIKLGGITVSAIIGSVIAKYLGLRAPMLLQTIPLCIAGFIGFSLKEPKVSDKTEQKIPYTKVLTGGIKYFFKNKILKILALDMIFVNALAWVIIWFYQPILMHLGVDIAYFGSIHAMMSFAQIIIISNFIRLEKILGSKKRLLFIGSFITGVSFIALGLSRTVAVVIIFIIFGAAFGLNRLPLFISYMNKYIPSDKRATVLSTTSMLNRLAIAVVNPIAGFIGDFSIHLSIALLGGAILIFSFLSKIKEEHLID
jgi:MFS family permease